MAIFISNEQRQAIKERGKLPLKVSDCETDQVFFLISAEQYHLARAILEGVEEIDPSFYEIDDVELFDAQ